MGQGHDGNGSLPVRGRINWLEIEGRERSRGGLHRRSSRSVEKGWLFQGRRCAQLEAQTETCNTCAQGCQPIHERALRLQSQASIQNREGIPDEKAQGVDQLTMQTFGNHCTEDTESFQVKARSHLSYVMFCT